jgi:16S rRNA (cytosine1402-N4)-methyltransferase
VIALDIPSPTHIPVLVNQIITGLQPQPGGHFIDCTVGLGGHASAILEKILPDGKLLGIDADPDAIHLTNAKLAHYGDALILVNDNFANLKNICKEYDFHPVDGILFDLGVSSLQLDTAQRGFSFQREAPLDMRFNTNQGLTAADLVNMLYEQELARILREYGEEHHSRKIAQCIVQNRPIHTTLKLARVVKQVLGGKHVRIHPATRTFMALRIAVNSELENLETALEQTINLLRPGGRLVVVSYHSLEDRIVKRFMRQESSTETPTLRLISRKVIRPTSLEIKSNPRSRSAKLRVAERLS